MNEEQVLNALSCLTNGALNYYQAPQTVIVKDELIRNYITNLQKQNTELKDNRNKLKEWLEEEIYNIEPKGTAINYNCEYDSEEDYINAMKERSKLITLKRVLINLQEIEGRMNE